MLKKFLHLLFTETKKFKVYKRFKIRVIFKPYIFLNEKNYLCERKFGQVTIHTHNTLPVYFPTLLPMRVHDIQRHRTLNIAIPTCKGMMLLKLKDRKNKINFNVSIKIFFTTPKGMMLLKLKDRKNKINFNVSIKIFFTTPIKHKTYTNTHELFLS